MQEKPVHGMHGSWFTRPKFSLELRCNEKGCSCDKERHRYPVGSYSKINRLNQAMDILQSAWAEDDYLLSQYTGEMKARGKAPEELTRELKLNGCEIKYAQHTLKTYFGEVSTKIYNERENIQARINKGDKECVEPAPIDWENAPNDGIFEEHRYENESRSYQMCMMENEVARRDNEFQKELNEEHYRELKRNLATLERPRIKQR
ncbi:hypothetical protein EZV61_11390 [Corallincola luteus]|uniref:Uncharacterized protein n=1 Tax=Corallincola luteus TaxID=1775177 RepID=A0ABY2AJA7_9GAMM|nr:hypothetical protein [Corallincola luteus]TCI02891.1 hypothetical protein EZV61_11390 [Corallincola luteus]